MKISELASRIKIDTSTIRYYESKGLIDKPKRLANGYRNYSEKSLQQLTFIKKAKLVGFKLDEIKQLLSIQVTADEHTCKEVKEYTSFKLSEIEKKIVELSEIKTALKSIHDSCCGGMENATHCSILSALAGTHA